MLNVFDNRKLINWVLQDMKIFEICVYYLVDKTKTIEEEHMEIILVIIINLLVEKDDSLSPHTSTSLINDYNLFYVLSE